MTIVRMETEIRTQIGEIVDFINTECRKEACVDTVNQKIDEVKNLMNKKEKEVNALAAERIKAHNEIVEQQKKVKKALIEKKK